MTGLNPNVIRSNGVWKWRRFAAGSACGPSGGSFASEAARDVPQMFVRPSARSVNPYAAAVLIGPETLWTPIRADPFTTSSTSNFCTAGFVKWRLFVHRSVPFRPLRSGNQFTLGGGAFAVRLVAFSETVVMGAAVPPLCSNTTFTGPTPYTHHTVLMPLPYGSPSAPACESSERIFAASTGIGNAGTVTLSVPRYVEELVTSLLAPPVPVHAVPRRSGSVRSGVRDPQARS